MTTTDDKCQGCQQNSAEVLAYWSTGGEEPETLSTRLCRACLSAQAEFVSFVGFRPLKKRSVKS